MKLSAILEHNTRYHGASIKALMREVKYLDGTLFRDHCWVAIEEIATIRPYAGFEAHITFEASTKEYLKVIKEETNQTLTNFKISKVKYVKKPKTKKVKTATNHKKRLDSLFDKIKSN